MSTVDFSRRRADDVIAELTEAANALKHYVPDDDELVERAAEWSSRIRHAERTLAETRREWEKSALELSDGQTITDLTDDGDNPASISRAPVREWFHNWPRIIDDLFTYNEGSGLGVARDLVVAGLLPEKGGIQKIRAIIDDDHLDERRVPDRSDWEPRELDEWSLDDPHSVNVRTGWKVDRT